MQEEEVDIPVGPAPVAAATGPPASRDTRGPRGVPVSFKLRFASQREPGRSNISSVKPLGLPATVTDKFYSVRAAESEWERGRAAAALARLQRELRAGPRGKHRMPITSAHEYGWYWEEASKMASTTFADRRLHHHIQDSAWLKARLIVLAADDKLKHK